MSEDATNNAKPGTSSQKVPTLASGITHHSPQSKNQIEEVAKEEKKPGWWEKLRIEKKKEIGKWDQQKLPYVCAEISLTLAPKCTFTCCGN